MALQCVAGVCREEGVFDEYALIEEACPSLQLSGSGRFRKSHYSGQKAGIPDSWLADWSWLELAGVSGFLTCMQYY